jgi:hypothetical protein
MSERTAACDALARLLAELQRLREDWRASPDTLLRLAAGRLETPLDALAEIEELMRRGTRVMGGG